MGLLFRLVWLFLVGVLLGDNLRGLLVRLGRDMGLRVRRVVWRERGIGLLDGLVLRLFELTLTFFLDFFYDDTPLLF